MGRAVVKLEGFQEIDAALAQFPKATGRNVMRRAAVNALEPIAEGMRQRAPVDDADLRNSIEVSTKRPRRHRKLAEVEAYAGPGRHPQAHLQEFGTNHHAPQPFARPAWDAEKDGILPALGDELWSEIEKAAARAARKAARRGG
jgi:HK97 gp10 family phage protein